MTYDGLGRQMLTTFADGKYIQTLRNERDQVYITFKRSGEVRQAYYDALGRVFRIWEHSAASAIPAQPYPIGRHTKWTPGWRWCSRSPASRSIPSTGSTPTTRAA